VKNNLKAIRKAQNLTLQQLEQMLGGEWSFKTISNFENEKTAASNRLIERLSAVLKVQPKEISPEYSDFSGDVRAAAIQEVATYRGRRKVPVVGFVAGANFLSGRGFNYSDLANQIEEDIETDSKDPNALGLIVEGDSMEPEYLAGDRIIVAPNAEPRNRDVVVARLLEEGSAMLKRFFRTGSEGKTIRLESTNPHYPPITKEISDFRFIYPVVEMQRKARR
jgi:SOS-response transcriptional repressor LexA